MENDDGTSPNMFAFQPQHGSRIHAFQLRPVALNTEKVNTSIDSYKFEEENDIVNQT
mgnify:CR=1 FL=1